MSEEEGLIFGYILDGNGNGLAVDWEQIVQWTPDQGTLWIHLDYTHEEVQKWMETESRLDEISREILIMLISSGILRSPDGDAHRGSHGFCHHLVYLAYFFSEKDDLTYRSFADPVTRRN